MFGFFMCWVKMWVIVKITTQFTEADSLRENPDVQHTVNKQLLPSVIQKQNLKLKSERCTSCWYNPIEMKWKGL